jgi:hypothetical protein
LWLKRSSLKALKTMSTPSSNSSRLAVLVGERRAEGLDLAGVVAARHAEDHPALAQYVCNRIVLGQPQRMPHRHHVEAAADLEVPGLVDQVHRQHQQVGDALGAFGLEMVFRHPEGVVAQPVHLLGVGDRLVQCTSELLVGIPTVVDRRAEIAEILHVDGADIGAVELGDHGASPPPDGGKALECPPDRTEASDGQAV